MKFSKAQNYLTNRQLLLGLMLVGLFLCLVSVRLWVIKDYGTPLPYLDEWVLELPFLLLYSEGQLDFQSLMVTANEHRNVWPRLISIALYSLNGQQWDPQLMMLVNAVLAGFAMSLIVIFLMRGLPDHLKLCFIGATLLIGLQPWDWFSVVWGIQILSYLLLVLSIAGMSLVALHPLRSGWFWLGVFLLINCHLTMGSGFTAAGCAAGLFGWRAVMRPGAESRSANIIKCLLCMVVAGLVIFSRARTTLDTESAGLGEFFVSLAQHLAFPFSLHLGQQLVTWLGLLLPLPVLVLGLLYIGSLRRDLPMRPRVELCLLLASWLLLQFVTLAWFRGSEGQGPALRHLQIHTIWLLVCVGCLLWCVTLLPQVTRWSQNLRVRAWLAFGGALYVAILFTGGILLTAQTVDYLKDRAQGNVTRLRNVQNFLATGEAEPMLEARWPDIPWKDSRQLVAALSKPQVQNILPPRPRAPLKLPPPSKEGRGISKKNLPQYLPRTEALQFYGSYQPDVVTPRHGSVIFGPLQTEFTHLMIWATGDVEDPEITMALRSLDGQKTVVFQRLDPLSPLPVYEGRAWFRYIAKVPSPTFMLLARDSSVTGWLTFSEPFEINHLSVLGYKIRKNWVNALFAGVLLLAWAGVLLIYRPISRVAVAK